MAICRPYWTSRSEIKVWLSVVEKVTGRRPIIYTSRRVWEALKLPAEFGDYPLWVARYGSSYQEPPLPAGWKNWTFHQYQADMPIAGIGNADVNIFNGTDDDLRTFAEGA